MGESPSFQMTAPGRISTDAERPTVVFKVGPAAVAVLMLTMRCPIPSEAPTRPAGIGLH